MDNNKKQSIITLDSIISLIDVCFEQGTETVKTYLSSDDFADMCEIAKDVGSDLSTTIKMFSLIKKSFSIPDKWFMKKLERYCQGLIDIPLEKRKKYLKKVGKESLNKDSVFILGVINKIEELSKIDMLLKILEAKISNIIDDVMYRRLSLLVDKTMYSDLLYLKNNITENCIKINSDEEEGLLSSGWLIFAGIGIGSATEEGGNLYQYSNVAKKFCELIQ